MAINDIDRDTLFGQKSAFNSVKYMEQLLGPRGLEPGHSHPQRMAIQESSQPHNSQCKGLRDHPGLAELGEDSSSF